MARVAARIDRFFQAVRSDNARIKIGEEKKEVRNNRQRCCGSRRAAKVGSIRNNRRLRELCECAGGQTERARDTRSRLFFHDQTRAESGHR